MYEHLCTGAECPHCGPFSIQHFRDSRGLPVTQEPKDVRASTTIIIVDELSYATIAPRAHWKVLCQQRKDNQWWAFPGGSQHLGESIIACALREAFEETGLVVHILGVTSIDSDPRQYAISTYPNGCIHYTNITFLGIAAESDGTVNQESESICLGWYPVSSLPEPFLLNHRWRLEKAMSHLGNYIAVR